MVEPVIALTEALRALVRKLTQVPLAKMTLMNVSNIPKYVERMAYVKINPVAMNVFVMMALKDMTAQKTSMSVNLWYITQCA